MEENFHIGGKEAITIINNIKDGLLVFDSRGNVVLVNPMVEKLFNVKSSDILGKRINNFITFPKIKYLFYLLGEGIKEVEKKELKIKDDLVLEVTVIPVEINDNNLSKMVIIHDITKEKMADRMKTEFVSVAAHQLRTPLSAIKWIFERLINDKSLNLKEGQKKIIKEGLDSTNRVISIVNDLLDIVRIEEGREVYKLIPYNLEKVAQSVIETYREIIKKKNIKFEYNVLNRKLPKVKIDPQKIYLVIQNLLDNAIRYSPPGGIVSINIMSDGKDVKFSISDTGIGIPKKEKDSIFKKFFRGSNATKAHTEGNGIGLYIAKNIIEAHGGKIWFDSEENKGTTFYFTLPIKK